MIGMKVIALMFFLPTKFEIAKHIFCFKLKNFILVWNLKTLDLNETLLWLLQVLGGVSIF